MRPIQSQYISASVMRVICSTALKRSPYISRESLNFISFYVELIAILDDSAEALKATVH